VVILAGINAPQACPATLDRLQIISSRCIELAQANQIEVILCSVLQHMISLGKPNQNPAEKVITLNKMIKKY
jgi:hypothetical protein